jgi:hypothetical protein
MVRIDYYLKGCMVEQKCKNNKEGTNEITLCQFSKMSLWVEITSTPTTMQSKISLRVDDYW